MVTTTDPTVHYVDDMGYCHVARVLAATSPEGLQIEYSSHGQLIRTSDVWMQTGPFKTPGYWHELRDCERLS